MFSTLAPECPSHRTSCYFPIQEAWLTSSLWPPQSLKVNNSGSLLSIGWQRVTVSNAGLFLSPTRLSVMFQVFSPSLSTIARQDPSSWSKHQNTQDLKTSLNVWDKLHNHFSDKFGSPPWLGQPRIAVKWCEYCGLLFRCSVVITDHNMTHYHR